LSRALDEWRVVLRRLGASGPNRALGLARPATRAVDVAGFSYSEVEQFHAIYVVVGYARFR
jgi:hypothetical protein